MQTNQSTAIRILTGTAIAAYVLLFGLIAHLKYTYYGFSDFDLAVHTQSTWNIVHGSIDSSILGIPFPGNHMALILFLIAPLYAMFSNPLLLLHIQTAVLAAGAIGIFMLAKRELSEKWAAALVIAYLAYPPLIYMNLYEFHPVALASSFLIFMMYYYKAENFRAFLIFLILALLCQENISLIIMAFAVYAFLDKRRGKWAWTPLLAGMLYFILAVVIIMPRLNNNTIQFWQLYAHLGSSPSDAISNIIRHPLLTFRIMTNPDKMAFISSLLGPLGFMSLLDPLTLIPSLPILMQRLLSDRFTETKIMFHYQAEFIPFIFISAVYAVKRIQSWKFRVAQFLPVIILALFPAAALISSDIPLRTKLAFNLKTTCHKAIKDRALASIPRESTVAATFDFLPKLANRTGLHSLHHIYTGSYTLSTAPYKNPGNIKHVIIDTIDWLTFRSKSFYGPEQYRNLQAMISNGTWEASLNAETILVLTKVAASPDQVPEIIHFAPPSTAMNTNIVQNHPASLHLAGFTIQTRQNDGYTPLTLFWTKNQQDPVEYDIHLAFLAGNNIIYRGILTPGARIWPTQSWPVSAGTNTVIADEHGIYTSLPVTDISKLQLHAAIIPVN